MKCPRCGTENMPGAAACTGCGARFVMAQNARPPQQAPVTPASYSSYSGSGMPGGPYQDSSESSSEFYMPSPDQVLVDKDERVMATLKNGMALNYISGEGLRNERAFVTNKRLYYYYKQGIINITNEEDKIDVEDITGTKISSVSHYGLLIGAALILLLGLIALANDGDEAFAYCLLGAIALAIVFFLTRKRHMVVEYAGGSIRFSVKGYSMKNVRDFQNMIFKVKAAITGKR